LQIRGVPIFALLPLVMIGVAALSGAFSVLGTPLGTALAPITFGAGVGLGMLIKATNRSTGQDGPAQPGLATYWIFLCLITLRISVIIASGGPWTHSVLGVVSADLMLLSVGMAVTRLLTMWWNRLGSKDFRPMNRAVVERSGKARSAISGPGLEGTEPTSANS
jgi:hypothetical protein